MRYQRVISLTPSITETIYALGAEQRLVGVTDACDYPAATNSKPHVCSWFNPDIERIAELKPDLVLGLASAHGRLAGDVQKLGAECVLFNPTTIEQALEDMVQLATLLALPESGQSLVNALQRRLNLLATKVQQLTDMPHLAVSRVLDITSEDLIVAGPLSFQYDVIARAGGVNVTSSTAAAYPRVSFRLFKNWDPEVIFVCGTAPDFPAHLVAVPGWGALRAVRNGKLYQFDCGLTCRTGPRIVDMAELLFRTLYE